jgi:subtilisin family serine protease
MIKPSRTLPAARRLALLVALAGALLVPPMATARSDASAGEGPQRYIVELRDPPLALYDGRKLSRPLATGQASLEAVWEAGADALRLDLNSAAARSYLDYLEARHDEFGLEAAVALGRSLRPVYRYRLATNGMAVDLTPDEASELAQSPVVKAIHRDQRHYMETYAGPQWIGASELWDGLAGFPQARGEGIVVGVIDSGINWESPSFADPSLDGYVYTNPRGETYGLCSDPEVPCNNKLIGVYDYIDGDVPDTDEVEEYTKGRDVDGHGTHVTAIAAGSPVDVSLDGDGPFATVSGVAPRANLITYRVCHSGPCFGSAILQAIEQAVEDAVDVINYSIGSSPSDPWSDPIALAFGAAREAGILPVTSAGNGGPDPGTVGSPGNAPWMVAVGNASHNSLLALGFDLLSGPDGLACLEGNGQQVESTVGPLPVVFAGDAGDPLGCSPFPSGSMDGSIALVSRGDCLFETKGDNAAAAGAEFMVVYNNVPGVPGLMDLGDSTMPSCMVSLDQGIAARDHVQAEPGATGRVNFPVEILTDDSFGDMVFVDSARGPNQPPVEDVLKPNLIAPGTQILSAIEDGETYGTKSGTSMSSPHVAGAAALLKSVHPDWSANQIISAIETTAEPALAKNHGGSAAEPQDLGSGRPQLGEAANAGLYLDVTSQEFLTADPEFGGDPGNINLTGLVDSSCSDVCTFFRTVTDQMGGGNWTATAEDFPGGVDVEITPAAFTLGNGASRILRIDVDVSDVIVVGQWISGRVRLSAAGSSNQFLTVSVSASNLTIEDDRNGGWWGFQLAAPMDLLDATFQSGGLTRPERTSQVLPQDPTNDNPYDGGVGTFTKWHALPEGGLWLHAETLASTAEDLDLFVGRDDNGNGAADEFEELCASISPVDIENCDLYDLPPGDYWILVQNWTASEAGQDEATLISAAIAPSADSNLAASGPGIVAADETFDLRLSWDNLYALPGEEWLGAVGIGSTRESPNDVGVFPVRFRRTGIAAPATFPLLDGQDHHLALAAGGAHDRLFIDVPLGATRLSVTASSMDGAQNPGLTLELRRLDFADALSPPPFAAPPGGAPVVAADTGDGIGGPAVAVSGVSLQPGRWYAVLINGDDADAAIEIRAAVEFLGAAPQPIHRGLWEPSSRPGLGQGYEYNRGGTDRALIWYTYDEDGQPAWYIAGSAESPDNIWTSPLFRVTNDGNRQQLARVGYISVTTLAEDDSMFSYTLFGQSGTDRMQPLSPQTCPRVDGAERSYTGLWYRGIDGLGGASVLVSALTQAQIHYLFDAFGIPRWLVAQDLVNPEPTNSEMPLLQFNGFCAICNSAPVAFRTVGILERAFTDENGGSWTLDYLMEAPMSGSAQRTDAIIKLTDTLACE